MDTHMTEYEAHKKIFDEIGELKTSSAVQAVEMANMKGDISEIKEMVTALTSGLIKQSSSMQNKLFEVFKYVLIAALAGGAVTGMQGATGEMKEPPPIAAEAPKN